MRRSAVILLLATGCLEQADTGWWTEGEADPALHLDELEWFGLAPWDGLHLEWDPIPSGPTSDCSVWLRHEDGEWVHLPPRERCAGRYGPIAGLPLGRYDQLALRRGSFPVLGNLNQRWDIEGYLEALQPWGRDQAFDATLLEGAAFLVSDSSLQACPDQLGKEILLDMLPGVVWLEIVEVNQGSARFRLIQGLGDGPQDACVYLEDQASLSPTGELLWKETELALASDPPLDAYNLTLRAGFEPNASYAGGLELSGVLDMVGLEGQGDLGTWQETCELLASFGEPCEPCPYNARESCWRVDYFAGTATREELPYDASQLQACEVMLDLEYPDCNFGCSSAPRRKTALALLGFLALVTLRRRGP